MTKEIPSRRERRWIILREDGQHVSVGRRSNPSPDEIAQAEATLAAKGLAGWLAVMEGAYYDSLPPSLMLVRPLCNPEQPFAEAVNAFQAAHKALLDRFS
jgi:hypothetical protein